MKELAVLNPEAVEKALDLRSSEVLNSEAYRRELLHRILRSPPLARSERLGALLSYICEMSFKGASEKLNEQRIGRHVFGRAEDYDSSADGIVRSQASRLRQRLDQYFSDEGRDEPLLLSIPRGSYVPRFSERLGPSSDARQETSANELAPSNVGAQTTLVVPESRAHSLLPWLLVAILSTILCGVLFRNLHTHLGGSANARTEDPVLARFWSGLFPPGTTALLVTPDSGLVMYENFSGKRVDLKSYLDGRYRAGVSESGSKPAALIEPAPMLDLANRRYTSIVDVEAILHMQERARSSGGAIQVHYARDLRPNDLKSGSVILLGASTADPWVELFEKQMNFVLQDDYTRDRAVLNRQPLKGEPERWAFPHGNPNSEVFGVVAYRPNLAGEGNTLVLEGTSMSGTEAATDFIMDDSQFAPFLREIGSTKDRIPHFEVVLTTNNLGASAGRPRVLAWRRAP